MIREINIFLYGNYFIKEIDRMFKKMLIAVIANSQEDLCAVVDVARDYAKSYRIGVYNDKKDTLITLYISKGKFKRMAKRMNNSGYELEERSNGYIYTIKKVKGSEA